MKKILSISVCVLLLATAMLGCGGKDKDMKDDISSITSKVEDGISSTVSKVESGMSSMGSEMMPDSSK